LPAAIARRRSTSGPLGDGCLECLLQCVLGEIEVPDGADEAREDAPVLAPVKLLDAQIETGVGATGRTSTEPPIRIDGIRAAISIASSRSLHSSVM
jgi:hypothetical protein